MEIQYDKITTDGEVHLVHSFPNTNLDGKEVLYQLGGQGMLNPT